MAILYPIALGCLQLYAQHSEFTVVINIISGEALKINSDTH